MKRTYKTPEIEVEKFSIVNIATTSGDGNPDNGFDFDADTYILDDETNPAIF